ncbi:MAG: molybdenum ABC transporter ATP-binding protein [Pseudomonadota bacterium]
MSGTRLEARYRLPRGGFALDIDLDLPAEGVIGLFGVSGSGKTTLLRCLAGLERQAIGRFALNGDVFDDAEAGLRLPPWKRGISVVFQEPRLFAHLDVERNIRYGEQRTSRSPPVEFAALVELLGLAPLLGRKPARLSGGEAQRVAIARALMSAPRLVLMDEPLSALDIARRNEVLPFLERLHAALPVPLMYVSHQQDEILRLADTLLVLDEGRVLAAGPLPDLLARADLPGLSGDSAAVVVPGVARAMDAEFDMTEVATGAGSLWVTSRYTPGTPLRLLVRARDVSVSLAMPEGSSIQNRVPAVIAAVMETGGPTVVLRLDARGTVLLACVTRRAVAELDLRPGRAVFANIKSAAVRQASV